MAPVVVLLIAAFAAASGFSPAWTTKQTENTEGNSGDGAPVSFFSKPLQPQGDGSTETVEQQLKSAQDQLQKAAAAPKCPMDTINIVMDQKPEGLRDGVTVEDLRAHFAAPESVEWVNINTATFSDIDGRNEERILATPGGDLAEFILALDVWSEETKKTLELEEVVSLMADFLVGTKKSKFQATTTDAAVGALRASVFTPDLKLSDPGMELRLELLDRVALPEFIGNDHLKAMVGNAAGYRTNTELVENGLKAFHLLMWNRTFEANKKLKYTMLSGQHSEKGFVNVQTDPICMDLGIAPLVAPRSCKSPVFVTHIQAVTKLRGEYAHFFAKGDAALKRTLVEKMNVKGTYQLSKTAISLVGHFPVYTITYTVAKYDE